VPAKSPFQDFCRTWDDAARKAAALLRSAAGRAPDDRDLTETSSENWPPSDEFRPLCAAHDVRLHRSGSKQVHPPVVGDLDLTFSSLQNFVQLRPVRAHPNLTSDGGVKGVRLGSVSFFSDTAGMNSYP
jgi:hypothetical protein